MMWYLSLEISNIERHQVNLRAAKNWSGHETGLSVQWHELYNMQSGHSGSHWADCGSPLMEIGDPGT